MCARVYIDINVRVKPPNKTICIVFNCISLSLRKMYLYIIYRESNGKTRRFIGCKVPKVFADINITIHKFISTV